MEGFVCEAEQFFIELFRISEESQLQNLVRIFRSNSSELIQEKGSNNFVNLMNNYMQDLFQSIHSKQNEAKSKPQAPPSKKLKTRQAKLLAKIGKARKKKRRKKPKLAPESQKGSKIIEEQPDTGAESQSGPTGHSLLAGKNCIICNESLRPDQLVLLNANIQGQNFSTMVFQELGIKECTGFRKWRGRTD